MKKIICLLLVCLLVLSATSALAKGYTINLKVDVPTSLDITKDIPEIERYTSSQIECVPSSNNISAASGWLVNVKPSDPDAYNYATVDEENYYICQYYSDLRKPIVGAKYMWAIEVGITLDTGDTLDSIMVNGKKYEMHLWNQYEDEDEGTVRYYYDIFYPLGVIQEDGRIIPATGDGTPLMALSALLVLAVAGLYMTRKRRAC